MSFRTLLSQAMQEASGEQRLSKLTSLQCQLQARPEEADGLFPDLLPLSSHPDVLVRLIYLEFVNEYLHAVTKPLSKHRTLVGDIHASRVHGWT